MHTKKRHQNMFQDLNRKLHHAEKDRESPASDSKVNNQSDPLSSHPDQEKKKKKNIKFENPSEAILMFGRKKQKQNKQWFVQIPLLARVIRMHSLPSLLQSVRWSVSSGGSDKTNHSVSV